MRPLFTAIAAFLLAAASPKDSPQGAPPATQPFRDKGVPAGWVVRAWNDVSKPGPRDAVWAVSNETVYRCKNGCQNLVIVVSVGGPPATRPSGGKGYFLAAGPFVIKNGAEFRVPVAGRWVAFPPTEDFPPEG